MFDAEPGPAVVVGICDLGDRFRLVLNEITVVEPDEPPAQATGGSSAVWEPHPDLATSAECWRRLAARITRCCQLLSALKSYTISRR